MSTEAWVYDREDGVPINATTRDQWVRECVERVREGEDFCFQACGDSMVIALRMDGDGEVYWIDCRPRREGTVGIEGECDPLPRTNAAPLADPAADATEAQCAKLLKPDASPSRALPPSVERARRCDKHPLPAWTLMASEPCPTCDPTLHELWRTNADLSAAREVANDLRARLRAREEALRWLVGCVDRLGKSPVRDLDEAMARARAVLAPKEPSHG